MLSVEKAIYTFVNKYVNSLSLSVARHIDKEAYMCKSPLHDYF